MGLLDHTHGGLFIRVAKMFLEAVNKQSGIQLFCIIGSPKAYKINCQFSADLTHQNTLVEEHMAPPSEVPPATLKVPGV